jgi:uncharacterized protein YoaH (UPF0181 family)
MRNETDRGVIVGRLRDVADMSHDIVGPAKALRILPSQDGGFRMDQPIITPSGVWDEILVSLTRTAYRQAADRLSIPVKYLDQLVADEQGHLASYNFNRRAEHVGGTTLFRLLNLPDGWRLRAVLSDSYQAIDNLDLMAATASGMEAADVGLDLADVAADWTDDRFRLRIAVPQINLLVPELLADYRSPFAAPGTHLPVLWAGLEVSNSETGNGAVTLTPRAVVQICKNGLTRNADVVRAVHLGSRLDAGVVRWSHETRRKAVELIQSKVTDAVRQFCSVEYLELLAREMRAAKDHQVTNVSATFEKVRMDLGFSEAEIESALTCFMRGGDTSVLGVGQAVTAAAQLVDDGDRQSEMEHAFWQIVGRPAAYASVS